MRAKLISALIVLALCPVALAQISADVLGVHDMSPANGSPISGNLGSPCLYCHAPHSGIEGTPGISGTPLWSQKLSSVQSYQVYSSSTMVNQTNASPPLGTNSTLCLSCHDGTVALGTTTPYGQVAMSGTLSGTPADLGTNLASTHPFSFITPLQPTSDTWPSLSASPPSTQDTTGAVTLIKGNVECGSCHNPHVQNIDPSADFLVINNSESALCLACHNTIPNPSQPGMGLIAAPASSVSAKGAARANPLGLWRDSIHATANNQVSSELVSSSGLPSKKMSRAVSLGPYTTLRKNGCLSCHSTHNSAKVLLRTTGDQVCLACHNGGPSVSPPAPDISSEMTVPKISHSLATAAGNNAHVANESDLLNHNQHATCVDCHNPHGSKQVGLGFPLPPLIRPSQSGVEGISATDGRSVVSPAVNQYENCLRCHGTSTGKTTNTAIFGYMQNWLVSASDPLNILPQFGITATSKHPVMVDRSSPFPQPSLRPNMLDLDGVRPGRSMGLRILCTDCHNSDDNREFGGTGPNGPHGSRYSHLLERRYDMSQAPIPGQPITNLNIPPNLSNTGNYALCAKCHDLSSIMSNVTFSQHSRHINDGFSCSVCHTSHGMGSQMATVSGERMVNFDINVVAPNGRMPITYRKATDSCSLTCHGYVHNGSGGSLPPPGPVRPRPM